MEDTGTFNKWVMEVCEEFCKASVSQQKHLISTLIAHSGPAVLYHLQKSLPTLLKRDFIRLLPREITYYILQHLNIQTVEMCRLVSKEWMNIIDTCDCIWQRACISVGACLDNMAEMSYMELYFYTKRWWNRAKMGDIFEKKCIEAHTQRIRAVDALGDLLASGSDDRTVKIWERTSGNSLVTLYTSAVTVVKFAGELLLVACFDASITAWNWQLRIKARQFLGHTSAVLSLDIAEDLNVLASISACNNVKLWRFSDGSVLYNIPHFVQGSGVLNELKIFKGSSVNEDIIEFMVIAGWTELTICKFTLNSEIELTKKRVISARKSDNTAGGIYIMDNKLNFFTRDNFHYKCSLTGLDVTSDRLMDGGGRLRAIAAFGAAFSTELWDTDHNSSHMYIRNRRSQERKSTCVKFPVQLQGSSRTNWFCCGDTRWQDGISPLTAPRGLYLACGTDDGRLHLLSWRDPE